MLRINNYQMILLLLLFPMVGFGHWYELDGYKESIAFSRVATPGKVSAFIISTHWCNPCKTLASALKEDMTNGTIDPNEVDIYYCLISSGPKDDFKSLRKHSPYINWQYIDKLTSIFPTTYILTPTTNCIALIEGANYDQVSGKIASLVSAQRKYFNMNSLNYSCSGEPASSMDTDGSKFKKENKRLKKENRELNEKFKRIELLLQEQETSLKLENTTLEMYTERMKKDSIEKAELLFQSTQVESKLSYLNQVYKCEGKAIQLLLSTSFQRPYFFQDDDDKIYALLVGNGLDSSIIYSSKNVEETIRIIKSHDARIYVTQADMHLQGIANELNLDVKTLRRINNNNPSLTKGMLKGIEWIPRSTSIYL